MKHTYSATVQWEQQESEDSFLANSYSRKHTWLFDGGLSIPASASPQVVPLPLSDESAVDPEEAFIASVSSCHMLWFLAIVAKKGFTVTSYRDEAKGIMTKNDQHRIAITEIHLSPVVHFSGDSAPDLKALRELHDQAHRRCFIANSVTSEIIIHPQHPDTDH